MTIGERIKRLRKQLSLTQQQFAERISLKQNTITRLETGTSSPSPAVVALICREFNVNEKWLRDGVGEMFNDMSGSIINAMAEKYHLRDDQKKLIACFISLTDEQRKAIVFAVCKAAAEITDHANEETIATEQPKPEPTYTVELTEEEYRELLRIRTAKNSLEKS